MSLHCIVSLTVGLFRLDNWVIVKSCPQKHLLQNRMQWLCSKRMCGWRATKSRAALASSCVQDRMETDGQTETTASPPSPMQSLINRTSSEHAIHSITISQFTISSIHKSPLFAGMLYGDWFAVTWHWFAVLCGDLRRLGLPRNNGCNNSPHLCSAYDAAWKCCCCGLSESADPRICGSNADWVTLTLSLTLTVNLISKP